MPVTHLEGIKPPIHEQISELQSKIQLLEGDRKAFYENSQWNIKKNKESILRLRQENKKLHQRLADLLAGEEKVIKAAFQEHPTEQGAVKNKTGEGAVQIINHRLCEKINQLNNLKHQVEMRKLRLEELQTQYSTKAQEINDMQEMEEGNIEAAKTLRTLENRLEKARFKTEEAVRITNMYKKLKAHMQEESLHFQNKLDALEAEILRLRHELQELESVNTDAQHARNVAREQLLTQEENIYRERKIRDKKLKDIKKITEEKRAQNERAERRHSQKDRIPFGTEDLLREPQFKKSNILKTKQAVLTASENFDKVRAATGVTEANDVVACFLAQEETFKQLEEMKNENEVSLEQLKEEKDALLHELEHTKYSGEARKVGAQNLMKELHDHLQKEEKRRDATQAELDKVNRVLLNAKAGIEHLASKVQHIKLEDSHFASMELDEKASEYVLDLMAQTEEKLLYLVEFLKDRDKAELLRRIEEVEFHSKLERRLPAFNTRVKLPIAQKQDMYYDEEDSGEDDADVVTRAALKRQSQQIIEAKTKRRTRYRKKDGKL
ncbi:coiled coil domain-containing protein [Crotalus adamanteus]|uniref:Coiled coil domain-containing protein n=1 Tax=Crotalus adamanteus TaxID=8729 RepID=A0AAW1C1L7_CROAD|nr:coiled-coil domain-containing protein 151 [Protobothrops mucrosquamatus]XP_039192430.1 coiled-coil domain-containing protein 151 isoform X1 [Crotalus tigris]